MNIRNFLRGRRVWLASGLVLTGSLVTGLGFAFKPDYADFGHTMIVQQVLGWQEGEGYNFHNFPIKLFKTELADKTEVQFRDDAIADVVKGVQSVDWPSAKTVEMLSVSGDFFDPVVHCDNDEIVACSQNIRAKLYDSSTGIVAQLASAEPLDEEEGRKYVLMARIQLGKALHTIQDFYAHSNYVENNAGKTNNDDLYFKELSEPLTAPDALVFGTHAQNTFTTDLCAPRDDYIPVPISVAYPRGRFYTWARNAGNYELLPASRGKYTTGYFDYATLVNSEVAPDTNGSRCEHGIEPVALSTVTNNPDGLLQFSISGISKDAPYSKFTPEPQHIGDAQKTWLTASNASNDHIMASGYAARHTLAFMNTVISAIKAAPGDDEKHDRMIQLLLGDTPVTGFVIDRSGSMDIIMYEVSRMANKMIDALTPEQRKKTTFMLTSYSEVKSGSTWQIDRTKPERAKAEKFKPKLEELAARGGSGGGDCAEPTYEALYYAVKKVARRSKLYVFTDASSKGDEYLEKLRTEIRKKDIEINFSVSGSCSPIDAGYLQMAAESGGQVFLVDHATGAAGPAFAGMSAAIDGAEAFQNVHVENGKLNAAASKTITFAVETGAKKLNISLTHDDVNVSIVNPAGQIIAPEKFLGGSNLVMLNPQAGTWSVQLKNLASRGSASYSFSAKLLNSTYPYQLKQIDFSAAEESGRSGHEVHTLYSTPPVGLVRATLVLKSPSATTPAQYQMRAVAQDGSDLGELTMARVTADTYQGKVTLPNQPFRVKLLAKDGSGASVQRILPNLITPKLNTMEIVDLPLFVAGGTQTITLRIRNHGAQAQSVKLDALINAAPQGSAQPSIGEVSAILGGNVVEIGARSFIDVKLQSKIANTAPSLALGESVNANLQVALSSALGNDNFDVPFAIEKDSDGDGVPDRQEMGVFGTDQQYDGNADGIPDWQQAQVVSLYSKQRQAYLTAALDVGQFRNVRAQFASASEAGKYILDLLDFKIVNLNAGASASLKLILPRNRQAANYGVFGAEVGNVNPHWYDFVADAGNRTGASFDKNIIQLRFVDGGRGDDDVLANGEIKHVGGPDAVSFVGSNSAVSASMATSTPDVPSNTATIPPASGKSGGGGCTVGDPTQADMSLPLLSALALLGIAYRRRRAKVRQAR